MNFLVAINRCAIVRFPVDAANGAASTPSITFTKPSRNILPVLSIFILFSPSRDNVSAASNVMSGDLTEVEALDSMTTFPVVAPSPEASISISSAKIITFPSGAPITILPFSAY